MSYRSVYSSLNKIEIYGEMARNVFFKNILFYGGKKIMLDLNSFNFLKVKWSYWIVKIIDIFYT